MADYTQFMVEGNASVARLIEVSKAVAEIISEQKRNEMDFWLFEQRQFTRHLKNAADL